MTPAQIIKEIQSSSLIDDPSRELMIHGLAQAIELDFISNQSNLSPTIPEMCLAIRQLAKELIYIREKLPPEEASAF